MLSRICRWSALSSLSVAIFPSASKCSRTAVLMFSTRRPWQCWRTSDTGVSAGKPRCSTSLRARCVKSSLISLEISLPIVCSMRVSPTSTGSSRCESLALSSSTAFHSTDSSPSTDTIRSKAASMTFARAACAMPCEEAQAAVSFSTRSSNAGNSGPETSPSSTSSPAALAQHSASSPSSSARRSNWGWSAAKRRTNASTKRSSPGSSPPPRASDGPPARSIASRRAVHGGCRKASTRASLAARVAAACWSAADSNCTARATLMLRGSLTATTRWARGVGTNARSATSAP